VTYGAGIIIGVLAVWVCAAFGGGWPPGVMLVLGAAVAALVALAAARMGALDREGARLYLRSGQALANALLRWPGNMLAAFGVVSGGAARTGFVRLKLRPADDAGLAAVIETLSARPGILVVDADAGSLLAHAMNENAVDVDALKAVETRALGRSPGGSRERAP